MPGITCASAGWNSTSTCPVRRRRRRSGQCGAKAFLLRCPLPAAHRPLYDPAMATAAVLDREEYIEQVYFFRTFRERLGQNLAAQEILDHLHEEILATTRLPLAVQFLATELKHTGVLAAGFSRLSH